MQITPAPKPTPQPLKLRAFEKTGSTDAKVDTAFLNDILSEMSGPTDLVQLRTPSRKESLVEDVRTLLTKPETAQVALSLAGAAVGGPVGLAAAAVVNGAVSLATSSKNRIRNGLGTAALSAAIGATKFIPGVFGTVVSAGVTALTARAIANHGRPLNLPNIKLDKFAGKYLDKVQEQLGDKAEIERPNFEGLSARKAEKLAAHSITSALEVCMSQLSPTVAVALARDTAKEMVEPDGVEEYRYEKMISPKKDRPFADNAYIAELPSVTPAAASAQSVFVSPGAEEKYSPTALLAILGHELSHVKHRDIVGNLGEATLKTALKSVGNGSLNPKQWLRTGRLMKKVELAGAEISRENEYRCDQDSAAEMEGLGFKKEVVAGAFREIFENEKGNPGPLAAHPLPKDRITAVEQFLSPTPA